MSVKKVKISELPQLPQASDASGIFMPAADENNQTYRVPLSRYDKGPAGGDLSGSYPNPTIKSGVTLDGAKVKAAIAPTSDGLGLATVGQIYKAMELASNRLPGRVTSGYSIGPYVSSPYEGNIYFRGGVGMTCAPVLDEGSDLMQCIVDSYNVSTNAFPCVTVRLGLDRPMMYKGGPANPSLRYMFGFLRIIFGIGLLFDLSGGMYGGVWIGYGLGTAGNWTKILNLQVVPPWKSSDEPNDVATVSSVIEKAHNALEQQTL